MKASNEISNRKEASNSLPETADFSSGPADRPEGRFVLSGPSIVLDPAIHAYRSDLADIALAGQLFAPHYAKPVTRTCAVRTVVTRAPDANAEPVCDLQAGEEFALLDVTGGWAWGYCRKSHRVGYVPAAALP